MLEKLLILIGGYLFGAVPFGLIVAKRKGIDIRQHGSGNIGATNVLRVLGVKAGLLVFLLDVLKGFLPPFVMYQLFKGEAHLQSWATLAGIAAVIGHSFSPFIGFKGGKSVATGLGLLLGIHWAVGLLGFATFCVLTALTRFVSVGSIAAAASVPLYMVLFKMEPFPIAVITLACAFIIYRHRGNMKRLHDGTEPRLSLPGASKPGIERQHKPL